MDIQRLRSLTTDRLHTEIGHVYEYLETITGEKYLTTHILPVVANDVEPWLRKHMTDPRFWDSQWDAEHIGEHDLPEPAKADRETIFERYKAQPNPFNVKTLLQCR